MSRKGPVVYTRPESMVVVIFVDFVFFVVSGEVVMFNVMGGLGTLVGPIAGAAFFLLLREGFSRFFTEYYLIPVGLIFTAMVIFMPQGILGFLKRRLNQ